MPLPTKPVWSLIFSEGDEIDLRRMTIPAKSPKVAIRNFMRDYPNLTFRGMTAPGALPLVGEIPEMLPSGRMKRRNAA